MWREGIEGLNFHVHRDVAKRPNGCKIAHATCQQDATQVRPLALAEEFIEFGDPSGSTASAISRSPSHNRGTGAHDGRTASSVRRSQMKPIALRQRLATEIGRFPRRVLHLALTVTDDRISLAKYGYRRTRRAHDFGAKAGG